MALYVITDGDDQSIFVNGIANLKKKIADLVKDGYDSFHVYQVGKKVSFSVKTVIELKGE